MNRIADVKEDDWESLYEKRLRKKALATDNTIHHEVDPIDALPMKTLDGQLYYKTVPKGPNKFENANNADETVGENEDDEVEKDLSVEEAIEKKKFRLAEIGTSMLMDSEGNIKLLKEMFQIC